MDAFKDGWACCHRTGVVTRPGAAQAAVIARIRLSRRVTSAVRARRGLPASWSCRTRGACWAAWAAGAWRWSGENGTSRAVWGGTPR